MGTRKFQFYRELFRKLEHTENCLTEGKAVSIVTYDILFIGWQLLLSILPLWYFLAENALLTRKPQTEAQELEVGGGGAQSLVYGNQPAKLQVTEGIWEKHHQCLHNILKIGNWSFSESGSVVLKWFKMVFKWCLLSYRLCSQYYNSPPNKKWWSLEQSRISGCRGYVWDLPVFSLTWINHLYSRSSFHSNSFRFHLFRFKIIARVSAFMSIFNQIHTLLRLSVIHQNCSLLANVTSFSTFHCYP